MADAIIIPREIAEALLRRSNADKLIHLLSIYNMEAINSDSCVAHIEDDVLAAKMRCSKQKLKEYRFALEEFGAITIETTNLITAGNVPCNVVRIKHNVIGGLIRTKKDISEIKFNEKKISLKNFIREAESVKNISEVLNGIHSFSDVKKRKKFELSQDSLFEGTDYDDDFMDNYSSTEMMVGVADELILRNKLTWRLDIKISTTSGAFKQYCNVISWWIDNFPSCEKNALSNEYGGVRFDYISKKFKDWIVDKNKRLQNPIRTLKVFFERQMTAHDYLESRAYNVTDLVSDIKSGTAEWKKEMIFSLRGEREDYEYCVRWWLLEMPENLKAYLNKTYCVPNVEIVATELFMQIKSESARCTGVYERLIAKLNYIRKKQLSYK